MIVNFQRFLKQIEILLFMKMDDNKLVALLSQGNNTMQVVANDKDKSAAEMEQYLTSLENQRSLKTLQADLLDYRRQIECRVDAGIADGVILKNGRDEAIRKLWEAPVKLPGELKYQSSK
jgi:hypothetical protein